MVPEVITTRALFPDSVCIGTAAKGGELKIYFDASNPDETKGRIDNAVAAREYLLQKLGWPV